MCTRTLYCMTIFINIIIVCQLLASQPEREWWLENKKRNLLPELVVSTPMLFQPCKPPIRPRFFVSNRMVSYGWPYLRRLETKNHGWIGGSRGWTSQTLIDKYHSAILTIYNAGGRVSVGRWNTGKTVPSNPKVDQWYYILACEMYHGQYLLARIWLISWNTQSQTLIETSIHSI